MNEKRKYPRLESTLSIAISNPQWDVITETKNISASGAYCALSKPLPIMTKLDITLLIPFENKSIKKMKKINCRGVVVRDEYDKDNVECPYCVGIYFSEIEKKDRKTLLSYIDSHLKTSEPAHH